MRRRRSARRRGSSRRRLGRPNSLLKAAPPSGPSIMICSGARDVLGLAVAARAPTARRCRAGAGSTRVKPSGPPSACEPRPVAPSSRISPPAPVDAPGNGEIAVGWLCVSTFISTCAGSRRARVARRVGVALGQPALDLARLPSPRRCRCRRRPCAAARSCSVWRIIPNIELRLRHAVDREVGVEDLVAAVLAVGLREHHQLDVGRVAAAARVKASTR